jgi:hypothetical protein
MSVAVAKVGAALLIYGRGYEREEKSLRQQREVVVVM